MITMFTVDKAQAKIERNIPAPESAKLQNQYNLDEFNQTKIQLGH